MPKYKTIVFDSCSDLARLYFSYDMKKHAGDTEKIRAVNNYTGTTERLNMLVRRMKDIRKSGTEIVFTAHEDIQKVYARGGLITAKGQAPAEPIAVKGWPDMPGSRTPDEFCRAADNVLRVRYLNGKPAWVGRRESLSSANDYWEVKDRFNAPAISAGLLPASYTELAKLASTNPACYWAPPYIWLLYGAFGIGKTRSLLSFPRPMYVFDLDRGSRSIEQEAANPANEITLNTDINVEECDDYPTFVSTLADVINS